MAGFQPGSKEGLAYLQRLLVQRHVDPRAANAVFSVEGASGGIGDGGHAFGPGQFNNAGGVWTGRYAGMSPQQINELAWSPQGLQELADRVGRVAGGLKGRGAVNAIVRRFERPQDPNGEVNKALGHLGLPGQPFNAAWGTPGQPSPPKGPPPPGLWGTGSSKQALLGNLVDQQNAYLSGTPYNGPSTQQAMQQFNLMQQSQGGSPFFQTPINSGKADKQNFNPFNGKVRFLGNTQGENSSFLGALGSAVAGVGGTQVRITSGFRDPQHNAAVGGVKGSLHTRGDALDGYALIGGKWVPLGTALLPVARKYGLRSGDVAGFFNGGRDPVHVDYGASLSS